MARGHCESVSSQLTVLQCHYSDFMPCKLKYWIFCFVGLSSSKDLSSPLVVIHLSH